MTTSITPDPINYELITADLKAIYETKDRLEKLIHYFNDRYPFTITVELNKATSQ